MKEVTVIDQQNNVIRMGSARSMTDENGQEVLVITVNHKSRLATTSKAAAEAERPQKIKTVTKPKCAAGKTKPRKAAETPVMLTVAPETSPVGRRGKSVICKDTKVRFKSATEAARILFPDKPNAKSAIAHCCRGIQKSAYGKQFEYVD